MNKNTPTYLSLPHDKLPGIFNEIPVNRKARRIENRKLRQKREKGRFVVTACPLIIVEQGYYRVGPKDKIWRISRRDFIRPLKRLEAKVSNKRRLNDSAII